MRLQEDEAGRKVNRAADRRHARYTLSKPMSIRRRSGGAAAIAAVALEISESGVSAILPIELSLGETVELEVQLPKGKLKVMGIVRNRATFRYGFEFDACTEAERRLIQDSCTSLRLYTGSDY